MGLGAASSHVDQALLCQVQQSGDKGAILSVGSAFLIGVALGLAGQAQQGEPAHVGLSLGDDDNSDTKDKKESNREFDLV